MQTFSKDVENLKVFGRVFDENGQPVKDLSSSAIIVEQSYGENCSLTKPMALVDGYFTTSIKRYSDNRSFSFSL